MYKRFIEAVVKISEHGYLKTIRKTEIMKRVLKKPCVGDG
jgi:hypothetical protein